MTNKVTASTATGDAIHADDFAAIVEQHRDFMKLTDLGWMDEASALQDKAYAMGRARGVSESHRHQGEAIAWLVGTAIWWNLVEAERDANETGELLIPLCPCATAT